MWERVKLHRRQPSALRRHCGFVSDWRRLPVVAGPCRLSLIIAPGFVLISFATAAVTLKVSDEDFNTIPRAAQSLMQMFLGMASSEQYSHLTKFPLLFSCVVAFCFVTGALCGRLVCPLESPSLLINAWGGLYSPSAESFPWRSTGRPYGTCSL